MKQILLLTGLILFVFTSYSQTIISGMINADTILRRIKSPYLVSSDLVISPKGKIIIEPGVEIRFENGTSLEVRGTLLAIGTKTDSITFTSNSSTDKYSWTGINIKNTQGGNATFNYCRFLNAATAINEECCFGGIDAVKNSRFTNNGTAIGGYTGNIMTVDSCIFSRNTYCLIQADKTVNHCKFIGNEYGLYQTERIDVYNSEFTNNTQAALNGGRGIISHCTIENNNIGVQAFFEGFTIKNSTISNNETGIELGSNNGTVASITNSQICNNKNYNIKNNSSYNVNLYGNCWCSSDSTTVEDKIYDGIDNKNLGLISYELFDDSCNTVIKRVDKTIAESNRWILAKSPYVFNESFVVNTNDTLFIEPGVEARFENGTSLEVRGTLLAIGTKTDSITFTSNSSTDKYSWTGINIKNTQGGNATFNYCRFLNAATAINEECCFGGIDAVKNSRFTNNSTAIGGYTGNIMTVDSCIFSRNTYCLIQADKTVNHCKFIGNEYGLYQTERIDVYNSEFTNNTQAALNGGRGIISKCTIENNNIGVQAFFEGFTIKNSTISNNETGIELGSNNGTVASITNSQICNNKNYNIKNNSSYNVNLYGNCWCSSDSTTVEDKIYDGIDNKNLGLISYELFDDSCNTVIKRVDKTIAESNRWILAKSPYVFNESFVVNTNDTLFIEPGVEARFENGTSLEVRGTLLAIGTKTDSITFTSNSSTDKYSWTGINIKNTQGGNATFNYCRFLNAATAINEECCFGGIDAVKNSRFTNNSTAIGGYTGNIMTVDSCIFSRNTYCLIQADKTVNHCKFIGNEYGLYQTERIDVYNSEFTNNTQAALNGGRGIISKCTIENNNIGVQAFFEGFTIKNSTISNNETGIELGSNNGTVASITNSQICNNKNYNIKNNSSYNVNLYGNCWCNSDSTTVEDKIYDGWDNTSYGLVDYTLFSENCQVQIFKTIKLKNAVVYITDVREIKSVSNLIIYPNPASKLLIMKNIEGIEKIILVDYMGRVLYTNNCKNEDNLEINVSAFKNGLYILKTYKSESLIDSYKISVIR